MALTAQFKDTTFSVGDTVAVHHKVVEKGKERTQVFEGVVIAIKGRRPGTTFTVRRIASDGVGVERIWPLASPVLEKIVVKRKGKVRRAKLYYLRQRLGKRATLVKGRKETAPAQKATAADEKKKKKPSSATKEEKSSPKKD